MNAIDTNVLVYSADNEEPEKQATAVALVNEVIGGSVPTVMMWQVATEFLSCLRRWERQGRISRGDADLYLNRLLDVFELVCPTSDVIDIGVQLYQKYSLSHWDSMLIAACVEAGVTTLYSEDMGHGATYDTVTVVNPFDSKDASQST
jgi:predicted nucleic acid-binding protein